MPLTDWKIEHGSNEEGSTWAVLTIRHSDGSTSTEHFFQSFEEPGESARVQAA